LKASLILLPISDGIQGSFERLRLGFIALLVALACRAVSRWEGNDAVPDRVAALLCVSLHNVELAHVSSSKSEPHFPHSPDDRTVLRAGWRDGRECQAKKAPH
jgi:hypothetical protein